ncbi:MAG: cyclic pyranopterin monophosphate synthase MoaC [Peptococcaceae bacterium]|jgi:cyclic pyranopterin phosphate synthase|nr:cyclic pyranopterin monophosphate synthase MoaC [Peptococcaceae bacterium]
MAELTHLDNRGRARMVDVGNKPVTRREAVARGEVVMAAATLDLLVAGGAAKGDVLAAARVAGIMAAKETGRLIPLAHPLPLTGIRVDMVPMAPDRVLIEAGVSTEGRTGVEMEALTAVSVAALTVYDMLKAVDRSMSIERVRLVEKTGGRSGAYRRGGEGPWPG